MNRKEEIILATLDLASKNGLQSVTMSQISEKLGIKKPSLYNHFKSKEDIVSEMYQYLRRKSKEKNSFSEIDYGEYIKDKTVIEVLSLSVSNYNKMIMNDNMLKFLKVIYSERTINSYAAKILAEETKRMILATKNLFYALQIHNKIKVDNIDIVAISFAMTIHAMLDYKFDCISSNEYFEENMIQEYIEWFCNEYSIKNK